MWSLPADICQENGFKRFWTSISMAQEVAKNLRRHSRRLSSTAILGLLVSGILFYLGGPLWGAAFLLGAFTSLLAVFSFSYLSRERAI